MIALVFLWYLLAKLYRTQTEWCSTPLSTVFQSYQDDSSHYFMSSWVSPVLGWGSEVCYRRQKHCTKLIKSYNQNPEIQGAIQTFW